MKKFAQKVYENLRKVPKGKVATYKQLAELSGNLKACRAVGNILNKNEDFNKYPCHRVVKGNGEVGGYAKGREEKIRKLKKEGIVIRGNKIENFGLFIFKPNEKGGCEK